MKNILVLSPEKYSDPDRLRTIDVMLNPEVSRKRQISVSLTKQSITQFYFINIHSIHGLISTRDRHLLKELVLVVRVRGKRCSL